MRYSIEEGIVLNQEPGARIPSLLVSIVKHLSITALWQTGHNAVTVAAQFATGKMTQFRLLKLCIKRSILWTASLNNLQMFLVQNKRSDLLLVFLKTKTTKEIMLGDYRRLRILYWGENMTTGVWVLGDQLWTGQSTLSSFAEEKSQSQVIFIESLHHA